MSDPKPQKPVRIRLPDDLHEFVTQESHESMRSIGGQIAYYIREAKRRKDQAA